MEALVWVLTVSIAGIFFLYLLDFCIWLPCKNSSKLHGLLFLNRELKMRMAVSQHFLVGLLLKVNSADLHL